MSFLWRGGDLPQRWPWPRDVQTHAETQLTANRTFIMSTRAIRSSVTHFCSLDAHAHSTRALPLIEGTTEGWRSWKKFPFVTEQISFIIVQESIANNGKILFCCCWAATFVSDKFVAFSGKLTTGLVCIFIAHVATVVVTVTNPLRPDTAIVVALEVTGLTSDRCWKSMGTVHFTTLFSLLWAPNLCLWKKKFSRYSRQPASSAPSSQSICSSHFHFSGRQAPDPHWNSSSWHRPGGRLGQSTSSDMSVQSYALSHLRSKEKKMKRPRTPLVFAKSSWEDNTRRNENMPGSKSSGTNLWRIGMHCCPLMHENSVPAVQFRGGQSSCKQEQAKFFWFKRHSLSAMSCGKRKKHTHNKKLHSRHLITGIRAIIVSITGPGQRHATPVPTLKGLQVTSPTTCTSTNTTENGRLGQTGHCSFTCDERSNNDLFYRRARLFHLIHLHSRCQCRTLPPGGCTVRCRKCAAMNCTLRSLK